VSCGFSRHRLGVADYRREVILPDGARRTLIVLSIATCAVGVMVMIAAGRLDLLADDSARVHRIGMWIAISGVAIGLVAAASDLVRRRRRD
jgi:hypothetical protein